MMKRNKQRKKGSGIREEERVSIRAREEEG